MTEKADNWWVVAAAFAGRTTNGREAVHRIDEINFGLGERLGAWHV